ncbi:hypothetical protein BU15DRAFT_76665 [Melanogaster broomeanus]|nr:hypothetical protein BU15DRAFT_76665 [Melanogaster broomeanus]
MLTLRAASVCWVAAFLIKHVPVVRAAQVPLHSSHSSSQLASVADDDLRVAGWSLDEPANPNATGHLVFETVNSLVQQWPNTRLRNGHTIVPGTIPEGTLLYHGTDRNELPSGPEWAAVDPEHSIIFCTMGTEGWHLTLATTRPLKVVYFDGSGAAKTKWGSMDTQDLIAWGMLRPGWEYKEWQRIADLCDWGKDFGVDAFISEVLLCDFTSGVSVVSFLDVGTIVHPPNRQLLPGIPLDSPLPFETIHSGSWHNRFPGDSRIHLDLAGLVSFYDTKLVPSLVPIRAGQERWDHRLQNISSEDILAARARLAEALTRPDGRSSGIDWRALIRVIVDRYADRLELIQYLLSSQAIDSETILDLARKAQVQLRVMLTPYILRTATPLHGTNHDWAVPIFKLCATTHASSIQSDSPSMTPSEQLILQAIQETSREICRVVTSMWASGVHAGLDSMLNTQELPDVREVTNLMDAWSEDVNRLMAWLDWSVWVKCRPACGPAEICYLPTWPFDFPWLPWARKTDHPDSSSGTMFSVREDFRALSVEGLAAGQLGDESYVEPPPDEWLKPQPRCIRRVEPYAM